MQQKESLDDSLNEDDLNDYLSGKLGTGIRRQALMDWYDDFDDTVVKVFTENETEKEQTETRMWAEIHKRMLQQREGSGAKPNHWIWHAASRWVWAAACLVGLLFGIYMVKQIVDNDAVNPVSKVGQVHQNALLMKSSGHVGAVLTLSDGKTLSLDSSASGNIATQGSVKLIKSGAQVSYQNFTASRGTPKSELYNTMRTPRGKQFSLVLPDGTKVWLNAASSIRYPVHFNPKRRTVYVEGEVYFEVAHLTDVKTKKRIPFEVEAGSNRIRVLGTHFLVKNYPEAPSIKTTLLEGSVEVSIPGSTSVRIRPGQQAKWLRSAPKNLAVAVVDLDHEMAWRSNMFRFDDDELEDIMQQISRWYNVNVDCVASKRHLRFNGVLSKRANVEDLLKLLSATGVVKFKIDEGQIFAY